MTGFSAGVVPAALEAYDFSGIDVLVDVAGGHGMVLTSILRAYPHARHPVRSAACRRRQPDRSSRPPASRIACTTQSGDFFKDVPGRRRLHHEAHHPRLGRRAGRGRSWGTSGAQLDESRTGRVILLESVLQPGNQPDLGKLIDLEMLMMPGGRERTEASSRRSSTSAGFELTRVVPTRSPLSVVEARLH